MAQLGIRLLNFVDINHYTTAPYVQFVAGQDYDLYFQLTDLSQSCPPAPGGCSNSVPYTPNVSPLTAASGTVVYSGLDLTSTISASIAGIPHGQAWVTSDTATVAALAATISGDTVLSTLVTVIASGTTLTVTALPGLGALGNSLALQGTVVSGSGSAVYDPFLTGGSGAGSAVMRVDITNIDDALVVSRYATQPFLTLDATIWKLSILNTDPIPPGTTNMRITLTESGRQSLAYSQGAFRIGSASANNTQPGAPSGPRFNNTGF